MAAYVGLSSEEVNEVAQRFYDSRKLKSESRDNPKIVLIAAQPGAGKTVAAARVKEELQKEGGFVHVDADKMRHMINLDGAKATSQETQADAGAIANSVRAKAVEGRRNIIEEGTFRNADALSAYIDKARKSGYSLEMVAVATNREESILGIHQRYERQHEAGVDNPRFVTTEYHDSAMKGFDATIATQGDKLDLLRVIRRDGELIYDSSKENNFGSPLQAINNGRYLSDEKVKEIAKSWDKVLSSAEDRGAEKEYIDSIGEHKNRVEDLKKERIHSHAIEAIDSNLSELNKDRRFDDKKSDDLLKTAYYRGFHEKSAFFHEAKPDFQKFDSASVNTNLIESLPDIEELQVLQYERAHEKNNKNSGLDESQSI